MLGNNNFLDTWKHKSMIMLNPLVWSLGCSRKNRSVLSVADDALAPHIIRLSAAMILIIGVNRSLSSTNNNFNYLHHRKGKHFFMFLQNISVRKGLRRDHETFPNYRMLFDSQCIIWYVLLTSHYCKHARNKKGVTVITSIIVRDVMWADRVYINLQLSTALTHQPLDKMAAFSQTTFSNAFS